MSYERSLPFSHAAAKLTRRIDSAAEGRRFRPRVPGEYARTMPAFLPATRQRVLREDFPLQSSLALWKIIELGRVIDKDAVAYRLVWRPIEHQIDQDRIVRLGFGISHARVWPVAAPD